MKTTFKILALVLPLTIGIFSCEKDKKTTDPVVTEPPVTNPQVSTGSMKMEFNNRVDANPLVLNTTYTNAIGEAYTLKKFNYYISNVVLIKNDNTPVSVNAYQIIKQSDDTSRTMTLKGIPEGNYKAMKIMLGIDSASNRSGAHTGGLDFVYAADMFWSWNQGYIFLKAEGTATASPSGDFAYHIGGFGGTYKTQREFVFNFVTEQIIISKSTQPKVNLTVNVSELFKNPTPLSFVTNSNILTPGTKDTKTVADNYADMITFGSLKN